MTYNTQEISVQNGAPIEVYEFAYLPKYYRYTSAATDVVVNTQTFTAKPIRRSAIEASMEMARSAITITAPRDLPVADLYRITPPSDIVTVKIMRYHETDADGEIATIWMGRVLNARWKPDSTVELLCEPVYTSLKRPGLRRLYQRSCPHVLYSTACGAGAEAAKVTAIVDAISGTALQASEASAKPDGYFAGGFAAWVGVNGAFERRMIISHAGADMVLSASAPGLAANSVVYLYPGCDKTMTTCDTRFSNTDNFGGFPWIPGKNPFGSDPIY
jgi:uncharacterized phage protein (TIGR02218 family)